MDFEFSAEQDALRDSLRRYLQNHYSFEQRRAVLRSESGDNPKAWAAFADMGLLGLAIPQDMGGMGGTGIDILLAMELFGEHLALEPYLATVVLGAGILRDAGSPAQRALLPHVVAGEIRLALAHQEPQVRAIDGIVRTQATRLADGGWRLDGHKAVVLGAPAADYLLVSATTRTGQASVFMLERATPGLRLHAYANHDGQRAADVFLDNVAVPADALVGQAGDGMAIVERALQEANAALCCEAVGVMDALNRQTLEYLKTRKQFGVAIGSFQALQHRMADMTVATFQARSMALLVSARLHVASPAERARLVSAAKAYVCQQARFVGQQAVQLHGGMGIADELITGHYFKRLTLIGQTFGDAQYHLGRFSATLLETEAT
ncbi:MAG: acyl-CoA dehydrogenase family protein [Burkholderiales bacterium]|nr:acyl-CoA dehydrogenase family protein [Burkholderiales bacterium]